MTEEWSDWSSWSDWSTKETSETDSREVKSRTVYCFEGYRYCCKFCGKVDDGTISMMDVSHANTHANEGLISEAAVQNLYTYYRNPGDLPGKTREDVFRDVGVLRETKIFKFAENRWDSPGDGWLYSTDAGTEKQYSSRTRSKVSKETWSDWSEYVLEAPPEAENTEVKNRTVYRYRTRKMETLYQYRSWGEWSDWSTEIPNTSADTDSEQRVVYRYAEQLPFWKLLFGK